MVKVEQIIEFLINKNQLIKVIGDYSDKFIDNVNELDKSNETTLEWIKEDKQNKLEIALKTKGHTIVVDENFPCNELLEDKCLIFVKNPKLAIALIINEFLLKTNLEYGIHPTAVIHPEAQISDRVKIGAHCYIGKSVIKSNTIINPNVTIYDNCYIGENVVIHSGTVIGADGLGCERLEDGTLVKFPHSGGVEIHDNVEIGANCVIARGVFSNTIIGKGCKINGLCHIKHNCKLQENVWISGNTIVAGSTQIEKNVTIFSNVTIKQHLRIGEGAIIGMGAVVTKDVPPFEIWYGNPAMKKGNKND